MKKNKLDRYFVDCNSTTLKAIKKINQYGGSSLIVTRNKYFLAGMLSPRDLRKAIFSNSITDKTINKIYNPKCIYFYSDQIKKKFNKINSLINKLNVIPIISRKTKKIIDVLTKEKFFLLKNKKIRKINVSAVIMAGGRGTRLLPYTSVLPKPLLPLNSKPVIEHIVEKFVKYSFKNIFVTINYKSEMLKLFLNGLKKKTVKSTLNTIAEKKPMGTAGSLYSIKNKVEKNFFLTNCDTIINLDYYEIYSFHKKNNNDVTIVTAIKKNVIPYGVCEINSNNFQIKEKPTYTYNANTGFYVIKKSSINLLKKLSYLDFNEFLNLCNKNNKKIGIFRISERNWIDIGEMSKFKENLNKKV